MAVCAACLGEGHLDFRDDDAVIAETWTEEEIRSAVAAGFGYPLGVVTCDECEGSGVVSEERAADLRAVAVAAVDQALAKVLHEHPELR